MKQKLNIAVLYGGVSPEHEVAVITALQVMRALKKSGHQIIPVYITKRGDWIKGDERYLDFSFYLNLEKVAGSGKKIIFPAGKGALPLTKNWFGFSEEKTTIDVVFPVFHGQNGEDGTIQGLLELANLPYVGSGVLTGSAGMDKFVAKRVAEAIGIPVVKDLLINRSTYNHKEILKQVKTIGFPLYVKPANLGSSIGISRVTKATDLSDAIELAFCYDDRVLLEEAVNLDKEINISVMGDGRYEVSATEQPLASSDTLSFEDKYIANSQKEKGMASLKRIIPAPISSKDQALIQNYAQKIFGAINGKGLARVDFMMDKKGRIYFNEINTIPGSLAFYLWEKSGYPFEKLVGHLVDLALQSWQLKQQKITTFESNILAGLGKLGSKGKA